MTKRLEAVESKVAATAQAVQEPAGKEPTPSGKAKASRPDTRAHDLEMAVLKSPQSTDSLIATGGEIKELEDQVADTTDKVREISQKFKYFPEGFEFHGYMRSGFGINSKGGHQVAFQAPGADSKYRLGNETETYGELLFTQDFLPEQAAPFFNVNARLAFNTPENTGSDPGNDQFTLREAYAQMGNFDFAPGVSFWAGERFYRRHDIYIIDYYFLDMSGYGGGVEDINLFDWGKLAMAYIGGSSDDYQFSGIGNIAKNSFDVRIYDFDVPLGKGTIWLDPSFLKGGSYLDSAGMNQEYNNAQGFAAGFLHTAQDPFGMSGYNKLCVQYGMGSSADFSPNVETPDTKVQNRRTFRVTESGVIQPSDKFAMMYAFVYKSYDNGSDTDSRLDWYSAGARPIYFFNKHLALAVEAGVDHVKSWVDDYDDTLFKISFAPEIRIDNTFMGRPVLRLYVTYAAWGSDFKGRVGGSAYRDDKSGLAAGVQMEAWW